MAKQSVLYVRATEVEYTKGRDEREEKRGCDERLRVKMKRDKSERRRRSVKKKRCQVSRER